MIIPRSGRSRRRSWFPGPSSTGPSRWRSRTPPYRRSRCRRGSCSPDPQVAVASDERQLVIGVPVVLLLFPARETDLGVHDTASTGVLFVHSDDNADAVRLGVPVVLLLFPVGEIDLGVHDATSAVRIVEPGVPDEISDLELHRSTSQPW